MPRVVRIAGFLHGLAVAPCGCFWYRGLYAFRLKWVNQKRVTQ